MSLPPDDPTAANFSYETSKSLYLFTSLTAGSSHIITATSRLETILKANRIPFKAVDTATDEKARRIWGRRAQGKKLPGLVREGVVLADLEQVEEWNEYGELKQELGTGAAAPAAPVATVPTGAFQGHKMELPIREAPHRAASQAVNTGPPAQQSLQQSLASEAAAAAKQRKQGSSGITPLVDASKIKPIPAPAKAELDASTTTAPDDDDDDGDERASTTSPPIKREADHTSGLDEPATHNTSTSAALPALPKSLSPPTSPPTASILAASASSSDIESQPTASAGPASKSGLEAVTNDPAAAAAAAAATVPVDHDEEEEESSKAAVTSPTPSGKRGSFTQDASPEEIKAVEGRSVIPEDPREDDDDKKASTTSATTTANTEDEKGLRVKFQEDSLKGQADDGDAAGESVGD